MTEALSLKRHKLIQSILSLHMLAEIQIPLLPALYAFWVEEAKPAWYGLQKNSVQLLDIQYGCSATNSFRASSDIGVSCFCAFGIT